MQLSIIIVNYNVKYFLEQCLYSLMDACKNIEAEILVVDNNSSDGSQHFFDGRFTNVKFTWGKENLGFSKANNLALQEATGDYVLFLNPDTIVPEDCLEKCLAFFQSKKDIGALGVKMIDGSGLYLKESKRAFPDPLTSLCKLSGLARLFPRSKIFANYYLGHLSEKKDHEVDVLAGAFMMVGKDPLNKTDGFDEAFFMYGEDVDLSYRLQKAGYKNYYFSDATIIHFKGESTQKASFKYVRLFYGAMILFVNKHYKGGTATIYNSLIKVAIWLKGIAAGAAYILRPLKQKYKHRTDRTVLIVAGKTEFEKIYNILSNAGWRKKNIRQISLGHEDQPTIEGFVNKLQQEATIHLAAEVIFSNDGLAIKDIISAMPMLSPGLNYKLHLKNSSAIIGSSNKNIAGDYIAIEN